MTASRVAILFVISLLFQMIAISAFTFRPAAMRSAVISRSITRSTSLNMGLFDFLGGAKKSASASHILVKDQAKATKLKADLSKSKDLATDFATAASQFSTCPSGKKGGSLGTFKQGQMVPAFDKVVFSDEIGKIHGPVATQFGYHLILIENRSD